ncbi:Penicillin-binding protein 1A [Aliiroseovarius sp. xm-m-379]|uniref:penicillin-binding protein 1A n=1 Tax=unclassified Aliiroseovarius TaxID=2623558 RepID=UPI001569D1CF|nr:Penicillin-binding protein 1A [Aliiroseovarius sp. xm-d-517]NRP24602.1 Penicillin-binding protein 1A [Aliiroseovarius sp. xm-m-379]NRP30764.1 Penicillin-binding protein 1A [Aliiroseovarius sp. xm-m-314]NRP33401.1 Penicillin-binding protein 1A [Aliiroseovarius sp. xm-a-104]NRP40508.1 Penicillin-binding protein 1A [Aliiroseovarius sp. xm-m-339-2]NRP44678.1 Penicillin-binding protein 1A [Aliiroseovarius sp. xm-m-378]NRP50078.1 Penicillin-binding protein 1A [Aliiroseovarius sp. xm-m-354]NRP61
MVRFILGIFGSIFTFLTIGVFMGALVVGGVFWMYSQDLPSHEQLANYTPATISRVYSGEGNLMDEFARERRLYTPADEIPEMVKQAFISAEDKNFYNHKGFDLRGIVAAAIEAARGGRLRGASTISQQVVKNFLLSSERSAERKIKELILSVRLENSLDKDQILALYLNEIFLGQNSYGVTAAAQTYFNKTLDQLAPHEAAYLATLPKKPAKLHPVRNRKEALERRNYVLREMYQNGYLDQATYAAELEMPLRSVQAGDFPAFRQDLPPRDYFTDEIRRQLSRDFGEEEFFTGGMTVRATVDPHLQDVAAKSLRDGLEKYDRRQGVWRPTGVTIPVDKLQAQTSWRAALAEAKMPRDIEGWLPAVVLELGKNDARIGIEGVENDEDGHWIAAKDVQWARRRNPETGKLGRSARVASDLLKQGEVVLVRRLVDDNGAFLRWSLRQVPEVQGGFMAMDVNTGRVIAMQGGFSYQDSVFNRATQATRQPGSSFKPFVYASALDSGFSPATIVIDAPIEVQVGGGKVWRPKNASNKFYGPTPLRTGIEQSRNLMTVRLAQEIGMDTVAAYAERFGVYEEMNPFLANSLGSEETTLFKMVAAYAMFANGGERVEPTLVDRVQDRWGKTIYRHDRRDCVDCANPQLADGAELRIVSNRERVMDSITAYQLTSMMRGVVERGTASRTVNLPVPTAGKTGTTNDARDVWFVGFTSNIVAGCYIGYDRPRTMPGASGGGMCGPVFNSFMKEAIKEYGGGAFKVPEGGHFIKIDRFTGARLPNDASGEHVVAEYFRDGEEPLFGVMFDGGFAMGSNLPLFAPSESDGNSVVTTSTGEKVVVPGKADFGSLSSGGQY